MASVSPAFVLLRWGVGVGGGLNVESPSGPGTCYADQADFELTENCLPLRAAIQVCDPMPERPPVFPVPSSHPQTHLLHRTCHDLPGLTPPCVPLFSIPPPSLRCPLYRSQLAPVHSSWCVSFPMTQGHRHGPRLCWTTNA